MQVSIQISSNLRLFGEIKMPDDIPPYYRNDFTIGLGSHIPKSITEHHVFTFEKYLKPPTEVVNKSAKL